MDASTLVTMRCTACGALASATCSCGAPYDILSKSEVISRRRERAKELNAKGMTQTQIAAELKVSQFTISNDLGNLLETNKSKRPKTARNPKGAGRPKGSKRGRRHKPRKAEEKTAAEMMLDQGKSRTAVVAETGLSEHVVQLSMERELGRREMLDSLLDAAAAKNFTDKGSLRIDDAIRIHTARITKQFHQTVQDEVIRQIAAANDATRAQNKELNAKIFNLEAANSKLATMLQKQQIMTSADFMFVLSCLHPDSRAAVSEERLKRAFQIFEPKKYALTGEK